MASNGEQNGYFPDTIKKEKEDVVLDKGNVTSQEFKSRYVEHKKNLKIARKNHRNKFIPKEAHTFPKQERSINDEQELQRINKAQKNACVYVKEEKYVPPPYISIKKEETEVNSSHEEKRSIKVEQEEGAQDTAVDTKFSNDYSSSERLKRAKMFHSSMHMSAKDKKKILLHLDVSTVTYVGGQARLNQLLREAKKHKGKNCNCFRKRYFPNTIYLDTKRKSQ